jgi:hypothetical protein
MDIASDAAGIVINALTANSYCRPISELNRVHEA